MKFSDDVCRLKNTRKEEKRRSKRVRILRTKNFGVGKVNSRTNGGRSGDDVVDFIAILVFFFYTFLPLSFTLAITCWCEKYTTFPFLSCTYSLNATYKKYYNFFVCYFHWYWFCCSCTIRFFFNPHTHPCILLRSFSISFDSNNWAQLTLKILTERNVGVEKCIFSFLLW